MQNGFRKYLFNTGWLLSEKVFSGVINFILAIYIARYLGTLHYGSLTYAGGFAGILSFLVILGLDSIVVRELVKNSTNTESILGTAFFLKGTGGVLLTGICTAYILLSSETRPVSILILSFSLGYALQTFNIIELFFRAKVQSRYAAFSRGIATTAAGILKIVLIVKGADLIWFGWAFCAQQAVLSLSYILFYTSAGKNIFQIRFRPSLGKILLQDCWPLILTGTAVSVYMQIDKLMLRNMLNTSAVGLYGAAVNLTEVWNFFPLAVVGSLFPAIVKAKEQDLPVYREKLSRLYGLMVWSGIGISAIISVVSPFLVVFLYGETFTAATEALRIHIWSSVFVFLGVATGYFLIAENYTRISLFRALIGMIINVTLNIILIPRMGISGAALATVISYGAATLSIILFPQTSDQCSVLIRSLNPIALTRYLSTLIKTRDADD